MDPNAWQAYQAYSRLNAGGLEEHASYSSTPASLFLAHQHLREAASQHYQNQILPPSLVHAAASNKSHLHQQALANLNQMTSASIMNQQVNQWKMAEQRDLPPQQQVRRSVIETKSSQPAFPGQPPPLQERIRDGQLYSSSGGGQPPPRQSSQPRSVVHPTPAFPGIAPPHQSPQYANSYSPQTASSPHNYHSHSPQDFQREREKERQDQERRLREEERREQERIRREQERLRLEQQQKRREQERREHERIRAEQELLLKEQEERKRREEYERRKREEHEKRRREEQERQRKEQERIRQEQERLREQERIRQEQERLRKEQERIKLEQLEQQKLEEQQRDLGMARLGALGALNDHGDQHDMMYSEQMHSSDQAFHNTINFHELNLLSQGRQNIMIKEEQKPLMNNYNPWINRTTDLLDLSSGDTRDSQGEEGGFIPQILMNPWDPQQTPMMTLAPIANAMQQYQQQWLTHYQQAAMNMNDESFPLGKCRVLCISPDDDMGFLINLPAPCNLLFQPPPVEADGLMMKNVDSPFNLTFHKFIKDPDSSNRSNLTEAPEKPPEPYPGQYGSLPTPESTPTPGKKLYIPPYTPKATAKKEDPDVKISSSGFSRSIETKSSSKTANRLSLTHRPSSTKENGQVRPTNPSAKKKVKKEEQDKEPEPLLRRESSRRKAKEQSRAKRVAQAHLLMDEDDPTLNNPALDLEDSDADDEWTPIKEKEAQGRGRKGGSYSSDDEELSQIQDMIKRNKMKRSHPDADKEGPNKRLSTDVGDNNAHVPESEDSKDVKVGDFIIQKNEASDSSAPLWRIDGKTLIQKYECVNAELQEYKNVNTYSGWTQATRYKYNSVPVRIVRQSSKEIIVRRLPVDLDAATPTIPIFRPKGAEHSGQTKSPNLQDKCDRSKSETAQFQENFEVYMQTMISQCLDPNFLNEIFAEQDEYFVSNIEKVDSVTLLRKDKLLIGTSWTIGFQHALTVWPSMNDLGSEACTSTVCGGCEKEKARTMIQMFGQPYHPNTLCAVPPDTDAIMNRNFSVCFDCARLCKLYHKLHHQKYQLFVACSGIVDSRKKSTPGIDTTNILNELLADDAWLEQQFTVMQDLWAEADCYQR